MAPLRKRRAPPEIRPLLGQAPPPPEASSASTPSSRELWLAIHLPHLMLDALLSPAARGPGAAIATDDGTPRPPLAVVDRELRGGRIVCDCDAAAAESGVAPGMALNSALALLPGLQTLARDPAREQALLEFVAERGIERYTPRVSLEPPDAVLFEVRGSLRLLGGARALCARLREELLDAGIEARLALTPTPLAALWFVRAGEEVALRRPDELVGRVASLPLVVTRWPERHLQALATMGLRTVGECLRLPRDGFARRFEPEMLAMLDRATGRLPEARAPFRPSGRFTARRDLEPEITDASRLGAAIEPLLEELCEFLRRRGRGVQALELRLVHREGPATRLRQRFVQPVGGEARRIAELLRERLARAELPAPVRAIRLVSGPLLERPETAAALFAGDRRASGAGVPQLVERLRARFGSDAVHGLCLVPEHRPESACKPVPVVGSVGSESKVGRKARRAAAPETDGTDHRHRPVWLLAEPQALGGGELPRYEGLLEIEEGPERIESGWWDGHDVARDYYVARNPAGVRLWVYRERPRGKTGARGAVRGWFLHGVFG